MALVSDAPVVVEAGEKIGSRHQGWEAIRLGRLVYIMQNVAENDELSWPQRDDRLRRASELSVRSRSVCGSIKAGRVAVMESAVRHLGKPRARILRPFLNPEVTLVPVPRSAPLTENALWPSKVIADILAARGFGAEVCALIERTVAVRKSSTSRTDERPLIPEHMASMRIRADMLAPVQITLVDDRERSLGGIFIGIGKRDAVAMAASSVPSHKFAVFQSDPEASMQGGGHRQYREYCQGRQRRGGASGPFPKGASPAARGRVALLGNGGGAITCGPRLAAHRGGRAEMRRTYGTAH